MLVIIAEKQKPFQCGVSCNISIKSERTPADCQGNMLHSTWNITTSTAATDGLMMIVIWCNLMKITSNSLMQSAANMRHQIKSLFWSQIGFAGIFPFKWMATWLWFDLYQIEQPAKQAPAWSWAAGAWLANCYSIGSLKMLEFTRDQWVNRPSVFPPSNNRITCLAKQVGLDIHVKSLQSTWVIWWPAYAG